MITFDELFKIQSEVDSIIIGKLKKKHEEERDNSNTNFYKLLIGEKYNFANTLGDRKIAFKVELCEFANEVGWFKYWKESHILKHDRVKDEWADCLAFLLSIIITTGNEEFLKNKIDLSVFTDGGYTPREYNELMNNKLDNRHDYSFAFNSLMWMGLSLGYSAQELFEAYMIKSDENIRRAKEGY